MVVHSNNPVDLTGLAKRDLRDIEHSMDMQRKILDKQDIDEHTKECMMKAIYCALIVCKKRNKEKYTPKKYRKPSTDI